MNTRLTLQRSRYIHKVLHQNYYTHLHTGFLKMHRQLNLVPTVMQCKNGQLTKSSSQYAGGCCLLGRQAFRVACGPAICIYFLNNARRSQCCNIFEMTVSYNTNKSNLLQNHSLHCSPWLAIETDAFASTMPSAALGAVICQANLFTVYTCHSLQDLCSALLQICFRQYVW